MVELAVAIVAAAGSILTAYVAVIAKRTERTVNGRTAELLARVELLEELLAFARTAEAETAPQPRRRAVRPPHEDFS